MGVSTKLYLNTRWGLDDIKAIMERTQGKKVKIKSNHDIAPGFFTFTTGGQDVSVFINDQIPTGTATMLMMYATDEAHKLLKGIADVLGGILMDSDYDGQCQLINGAMYEEDGLPYFVKYAIIKDGIDPKDTQALLDSKKAWHERCGK